MTEAGDPHGLDMAEVMDGLYLGSEMAVDPTELRKCGVTHILTVSHQPVAAVCHQGFRYLHVASNDTEDADLLTKFQECFQFIDDGRKAGGVLVHCVAGMSRSATVVIGYVMSHTEHAQLDAARAFVAAKRPVIRPNPGFLEQLRLFELMGSQINPRHSHYINYRIQTLALKVQRGAKVDEVLGDLQSDPLQRKDQPTTAQANPSTFYKCRKCRRPLFRSTGVLPHGQGAGDAAFDWRGHQSVTTNLIGQELCQRSLFIQPVDWMKDNILEMEGKVICPKCSAKLGSYNWFGERCPCGTWVTPAFHIQTAKVDPCRTAPVGPVLEGEM